MYFSDMNIEFNRCEHLYIKGWLQSAHFLYRKWQFFDRIAEALSSKEYFPKQATQKLHIKLHNNR